MLPHQLVAVKMTLNDRYKRRRDYSKMEWFAKWRVVYLKQFLNCYLSMVMLLTPCPVIIPVMKYMEADRLLGTIGNNCVYKYNPWYTSPHVVSNQISSPAHYNSR